MLLLFRYNVVTLDLPRNISGPRVFSLFLSRNTAVASIGISRGTEVRFRARHWIMFTFHD